jgi:hypothetical protein
MTTPPFPPAGREPDLDSPTQPVSIPAPERPAFEPAAPEDMSAPAAAPVRAAPSRRSGGSGLLNLALGVALVVATAGVAFAIGRATAPTTTALVGVGPLAGGGNFPAVSFDPTTGGFPEGGVPAGGADGGGPRGGFGVGGGLTIEGTVDSVTADSVTIKTENGQTITVGLDPDTAYHQQTDASAAAVDTGATVIVRLDGGIRPGANGNGSADGSTLGSASDVTIVP